MIQRPKIIVGDAKFEPGTSAQKSGGALPMSYYISRPNLGNGYVGPHHCSLALKNPAIP